MNEDNLIEERKKKLIKLLKNNPFFSIFFWLGILTLLFSIFVKAGIGFPFIEGIYNTAPAHLWFLLSIALFISCSFIAYKKEKYSFYPLFAWIVYFAVWIRSVNISKLRDVTTGGWTLGPDLDPFLFLRWAEYIVEHGKLMMIDTMRYIPQFFNTRGELILLPYMIAWFHKIAAIFGSESVVQSAALFPVFMFGLTALIFFLLSREIFIDKLGRLKAELIAFFSTFLMIVSPSLFPRTIAGIPEKESAGFFFLFLTFYIFLKAWKSRGKYKPYILSLLAGLSTSAMALIWGGFIYIYAILGLTFLISFFLGKIGREEIIKYSIWLISASLFVQPFTTRYPIISIITSNTTGIAVFAFFISILHYILFEFKLIDKIKINYSTKVPKEIITLIIGLILIIIGLMIISPSFIFNFISHTEETLITPTADRLGITVAENKQPFYTEWSGNFGPTIKNFPVFFWLFFFGSIFLFNFMIRAFNKKEKTILVISYTLFLFCLIFSRYSETSILNGTSMQSVFVYALGILVFLISILYVYIKNYKKEGISLNKIDISLLLLLSFFFFSLVSARSAVRIIMVLVPPASMIVAYFAVEFLSASLKNKDETFRLIGISLAIVIIILSLFSGFNLYKQTKSSSENYAPYDYTFQWQEAMSWVRENTPKNAVFGHWWDYGYWVQSIGERATVLDGGNALPYWNHFMGRYALTGRNNNDALEFLYAHNTTHFLIDSTDIGKYSAFSSIGSDETYEDRKSWISTFQLNNQNIQEKKNSTLYFYSGGTYLDQDVFYEFNSTRIALPGYKAAIAGVLIEKDSEDNIITNPIGVFVYQNKQYQILLRYAGREGEIIDFGTGIESGIFLFPRLTQSSQGISLEKDGAMLWLTNKTVKSQLARLYLYSEDNSNFNLAHSEDSLIVSRIKEVYPQENLSSFVLFNGGLQGPIKIWEINYPANIKLNEKYLDTDYPEELSKA